MQEVFEKIIEKLESERGRYFLTIANTGEKSLDVAYEKVGEAIDKVIEIVKQEAAEYNNGWIPCSERLPDVPEGTDDDNCPEFNVTIKGATSTTTLKCAPDGTWFDEFGYSYPVSAWQPLPDYWKGEL